MTPIVTGPGDYRTASVALEAQITRQSGNDMDDLISRKSALDALSRAAWKHDGDDAYSAGMEDGARHQSSADHDAIRALPTPDDAALLAAALRLPEIAALVDLCRNRGGHGFASHEEAVIFQIEWGIQMDDLIERIPPLNKS